MVGERARFHNIGPSWGERAALGGLQAVVSAGGGRPAEFLHGVHLFAAYRARKRFPSTGVLVDFGCGNGRFSEHFASGGRSVLGTEITFEMALDARKTCRGTACQFVITDGISIPVPDRSVSAIWCCGVLRYSLLVENPCYSEIVEEMFRVLQPGGYVVNCEAYVDVPPGRFTEPFEKIGFATREVAVLNRYRFLDRIFWKRILPTKWGSYVGFISAMARSSLDSPRRATPGLRDYLFVWQKPKR